ncbi:MAG TPA: 50S ribosomal protein L25 [Candidatus Binataceae bacterium]|jgi:large subunit ribosomal protein L25|nr:50S ribosomal protein L25 [Candidatus Binataceae bacterium]
METVELSCELRETRPKGRRHELRRQGRIPAVLYGPKLAPMALAISGAELRARVSASGRQRLIRLKSSSPELNERHVIVKEIQRAPVSGAFLHADLYEVDLTHRLRVSVPLRFTGKARGVAEGGILQPLAREIEVECLPLEIPEVVEVDVSALGIHDVIHVSALNFAGNIKPIFDTDYPVVTVLPPTVEAAPAAAAAEAAAPAEGAAAPAEGAVAPAAVAEGSAKEGAAPAGGAAKKA